MQHPFKFTQHQNKTTATSNSYMGNIKKKLPPRNQPARRIPHGNINFNLNISNQPLQHSKNSIATPWGSPPLDLSPPARDRPESSPPPVRDTLPPRAPPPRRSHGCPRTPPPARARSSSTVSASASSITCDTLSLVADWPRSRTALPAPTEIQASSFASNLRNTRTISSFVSADTGVAGAEDDNSAFLGDGDDGMLPATEEDGEDERALRLSPPGSCGSHGARGARGEEAALAK
jgi:hypothetical protein